MCFFFFQAEDGIRDYKVTGVQTCALPIFSTDQLRVPASIRGNFQGTAAVFQQSLNNEPMLVAAALLAVYIVLGVLYESYVHPLTILSTMPSAGDGGVLPPIATNKKSSIKA